MLQKQLHKRSHQPIHKQQALLLPHKQERAELLVAEQLLSITYAEAEVEDLMLMVAGLMAYGMAEDSIVSGFGGESLTYGIMDSGHHTLNSGRGTHGGMITTIPLAHVVSASMNVIRNMNAQKAIARGNATVIMTTIKKGIFHEKQ